MRFGHGFHAGQADRMPGVVFFGGSTKPATQVTSTTTQNSAPWAGQQPYLGEQFNDAQNLLTGYAPQYYPGSTYVPTNWIQNSVGQTQYNTGIAGGDTSLQNSNAFLNNEMQGGTNPTNLQFGQTQNALSPLVQGQYANMYLPGAQVGQGVDQNYAAGAYLNQDQGNQNATNTLLSNEISGKYLNPNTDPGFQTVINNTLAATMPGIQSTFEAGGGLNSGLAAAASSQGANNAIGNLELQNYQAERQNQNAAGQQAAQNYMGEQGMQMGATGQLASNLGMGLQNQQSAMGLASNNALTQQGNQLAAAKAAPLTDMAQQSDLAAGANWGNLEQQNAQNVLQSNINAYNYNQMLPWNTLGMYSGLISGNYGGQSSGSSSQPYYENGLANTLGGINGIAGTASSLGMLGLLGAAVL